MPNPEKPKLTPAERLAKERREMPCRILEIRSVQRRDESVPEGEDDPFVYVEGKAVSFDDETVLFEIGGVQYKEVIKAGSFDEADTRDVVVKYNHTDSFLAVARTRNKTLELDIREDGVYVRIKIRKDNPNGMQFYKNVEEGLIDRMSFSFVVQEESYDEVEHRWTVMKIRKVYDVAAVDFPAYDNTEIYAKRFGDAEALQAEAEARKQRSEDGELERRRAAVMALLA